MAGLVPASQKHRGCSGFRGGAAACNLRPQRVWMAGTSPAVTIMVG